MNRYIYLLNGLPVYPPPRSSWSSAIALIWRIVLLMVINTFLGYQLWKLFFLDGWKHDGHRILTTVVCTAFTDMIILRSRKMHNLLKCVHRQNIVVPKFMRVKLYILLFMCSIDAVPFSIVMPLSKHNLLGSQGYNSTMIENATLQYYSLLSHSVFISVMFAIGISNLYFYYSMCNMIQIMLVAIRKQVSALPSRVSFYPNDIQVLSRRFITAAETAHLADDVFSVPYGIMTIGGVFLICTRAYYYLNVEMTLSNHLPRRWLIMQNLSALYVLTGFTFYAASVEEEAQQLARSISSLTWMLSTRNRALRLRCLHFMFLVKTMNVQMTLGKMYPLTRGIVPAVAGVTISYVVFIVQMHYITSINQRIHVERHVLFFAN